MSLWATPIDDLNFSHLDAFLNEHQVEGARLDYKADVPKELDKLICAFANTTGGIIVLGVDENKSTNEPVWPPADARLHVLLPEAVKLRDQIFGIAQTNIYPPVRVQVSKVIPNEHAPGKALVVIRVDMSKEAPHAVEKKQRVYVVEKADNVSDRFTFADIDRIEQLFNRRRAVVDRREAIVSETFRYLSALTGNARRSGEPLCFASFIPFYPWGQILDKEQCHELHRQITNYRRTRRYASFQSMPGGSIGLFRKHIAGTPIVEGMSVVQDCGHVLLGDAMMIGDMAKPFILFDDVIDILRQLKGFLPILFQTARERPGLCLLTLAFSGVNGFKMMPENYPVNGSKHPMIHHEFKVERTFDYDQFERDPLPILHDVLQEMLFCFDSDQDIKLGDNFSRWWA
jgi:hypothetical protein